MKKIVTLVLTFMALISLTACFDSPDKLYGYWKSEQNNSPFSGKQIIHIDKNIFEIDNKKFKNISLNKEGDLWTTSELTKVLGVSISYSFKIVDNDTIEAFANNDNEVKNKGKYIRITQEEAEEQSKSSWIKPSVKSPF